MAVPSNYRWVLIGEVAFRNDKRAPEGAEPFSLNEVMDIAKTRQQARTLCRTYAKESKTMWLSHIDESDPNYYKLLLHSGDKNIPDASYVDFGTLQGRDIPKEENEGGQYSAHILVKKAPFQNGNHLIYIEKVPNVYLNAVSDYLTWVCREEQFHKTVETEEGKNRSYRPIVEVLGYQSTTLRQALQTGVFEDMEVVSDVHYAQGVDEDPLIRQETSNIKLSVHKWVSEDQAKSIFGQVKDRFSDRERQPKFFVRVKSSAGQVKRTQVNLQDADDLEPVLDCPFVLNEKIEGFSSPLGQRHQAIRADVVQKMIESFSA